MFKGAAVYLVFSLATSGASFLASLLLLRLIEPSEFGRLGLFMSILYLITPLVSFAADNLVAVNYSRLAENEYLSFKTSYISLSYVMYLIVQVVFCLLWWLGLLSDPVFLLVPIYALTSFLIGTANIEYVYEGRAFIYGLLNLSTVLLALLLSLALIYLYSGTALWRALALVLSGVFFLLVRYRGRYATLCHLKFDFQIFREIMRFGAPLLVAVAAAWALNESDKLVVAKLLGLKEAGIYTAACIVGGIVSLLNQSLVNAIAPRLYKELGGHDANIKEIAIRYVRIVFIASMVIFCVIFFGYALVGEHLLPEKYAGSRPVVFFVLVGGVANGLYRAIGLVSDYYKLSVARMYSTIVAGGVAIISCILCTKLWGVLGAAAGASLGYLVLSLLLWLAVMGHLKKVVGNA